MPRGYQRLAPAVQVAGESVLAAVGRGAASEVVTLMECLLRDDSPGPGGALHDAVVVWLTDRGYLSPFLRVGTAALLGGRAALLGLLLRRRLLAAAGRPGAGAGPREAAARQAAGGSSRGGFATAEGDLAGDRGRGSVGPPGKEALQEGDSDEDWTLHLPGLS
jgi:hypothetical protein